MRFADLSAADQRLVRSGGARAVSQRTSRVERQDRTQPSYRCTVQTCEQAFASYAAAERHADEQGHARIECVL